MTTLKLVGPVLELDERTAAVQRDPRWRQEKYVLCASEFPTRSFCIAAESDEERPLRRTEAIARAISWRLPLVYLGLKGADAIAEADDHDEPVRHVAVFSGPHGTGKSIAACWLAMNRFAFLAPRFVSASKLARMDRDDEERDDLLGARALIIDDLGVESLVSRAAAQAWLADFDEIVNTFYEDERFLVITTNLSPPQFSKRYGERVADRLRDCAEWFPCVGKSLRRTR